MCNNNWDWEQEQKQDQAKVSPTSYLKHVYKCAFITRYLLQSISHIIILALFL